MRKMAAVTNWICQSSWTSCVFRILREVWISKKCPFKTRSLNRQFHFATSNLLLLNSPSSKEWQNSNFRNNYSKIQPTRPLPPPRLKKKKLTPTAKDDDCAINQRIDSNKTQTSLELQTLMQLSQGIMELWARKKTSTICKYLMISMNCGILIGWAEGKEVEAMMPTRGEPGEETLIGECFDRYRHT